MVYKHSFAQASLFIIFSYPVPESNIFKHLENRKMKWVHCFYSSSAAERHTSTHDPEAVLVVLNENALFIVAADKVTQILLQYWLFESLCIINCSDNFKLKQHVFCIISTWPLKLYKFKDLPIT